MSVAGIFYGLDAYAAIRLLMARVGSTQRQMAAMAAALAARRHEIVLILLDAGTRPHSPDADGRRPRLFDNLDWPR